MALQRFAQAVGGSPPPSVASDYFDFQARQSSINANRRTGSATKIATQNSKYITQKLDTFDSLTGLWEDKWMNGDKLPDGTKVTTEAYNQKMRDMLLGTQNPDGTPKDEGMLSFIQRVLQGENQDPGSLRPSDITSLENLNNSLTRAYNGASEASQADAAVTIGGRSIKIAPFYQLGDKIQNPGNWHAYMDSQNATKIHQVHEVAGDPMANFVLLPGTDIRIVPNLKTIPKDNVGTDVKSGDPGYQDFSKTMPDMVGRQEYWVPDPKGGRRSVLAGLDPANTAGQKWLYVNPDTGKAESLNYQTSPQFRTQNNSYRTPDGTAYVIDNGTYRPRTIQDDQKTDVLTKLPTYLPYNQTPFIDKNSLETFYKTVPPATQPPPSMGSTTGPVLGPPALVTQPVGPPAPKILNVSPNFLNRNPVSSKIGAPKSRAPVGLGGGFGLYGGGSF